MKPGMYDVSNYEYHSGPGISASHLVKLQKSAAHYKAWLDRAERKITDEMRIGTAVHSLVLEPQNFQDQIAVMPTLDKRTKLGREEFAQFAENNQRKTIITEAQNEIVKRIARSIHQNVGSDPELCELLIGHKEQSFYWEDPDTGILCRCRPDVLTEVGIITDLKTCEDASKEMFQLNLARSSYHIQAAFYLDGIAHTVEQAGLQGVVPKLPTHFCLLAVERDEPHEIGIFCLDEQAIDEGRKAYKAALAKLKPCLKTQVFPGYERKIEMLTLPHWALTRE